jgi:phosphatidylcholine synthase
MVHAYTASGLVLAAMAAAFIVAGGPEGFRYAFLLLLLATFIDSTDGVLARAANVRAVLPGFDGRRLDDIIDFQTYTSLPLLLLWRAQVLEPLGGAWLLAPLLASAYGFAQVDAKTRDGFFRGFPSYWNIIALYLYFLALPSGLALALLLSFSVLTFVPTRYLYLSQGGLLNGIALALGVPWAILLVLILLGMPANPLAWLLISLYYPAFYLTASWWVSWRTRRAGPSANPTRPRP